MAPATIRDVARVAGVGIGTVSRVLNNSSAVSQATRQRVLEAIEELDFTPNPTARRLSLGRSMTIGVVVPFFTNPSVVERLRGVIAALAESEYDLVLFDIETPARRDAFSYSLFHRERVDGLLVISLILTDDEVARLTQTGITTVMVDAYHSKLSRVIVDNVLGAYRATEHLLNLGHRRIAFISDFLDDPFNSPVRDRFRGYRQALADAGLAFRPEYHRQGPHGRRAAREAMYELMALPEPPTAVFAYSDTQATGVLQAATDMDLRIPEQLSLIGYDDIEIAEYLQLTTISQALYESGARGAELLLEELAAPSATAREVILPTELIVRQTTATAPDAT